MTETRRQRRAAILRRRRIAVAGALAVIAAGVGIGVAACAADADDAAGPSTAPPTASASPTPASAVDALLATTDDPAACAVDFVLDGVDLDPQLQTTGILYQGLPIPTAEGRVFAGWYGSADEAVAQDQTTRVNGAQIVACDDRRHTLHGAWKTPADVEAEGARVPILMYHQFTTKPEGEDNWLRLNYAYIGDFDAHLRHIAEGGFYLPTWDELSAFIDGALWLPDHSVIITDDDADPSWFELAAPLVEQYDLIATSFDVTGDGAPEQNAHILRRSHTHDMHTAGDNGEGRMVNWTAEEIAADMEASAEVLGGVKEVMAYPFGHHNETSKEGLRLAGFDLARTIEQGYVTVGTDKLALPTIRINYGMGVDALRGLIG